MFTHLLSLLLACTIVLSGVISATATNIRGVTAAEEACTLLQQAFPAAVFYPGSRQFAADILHASATGTQVSTCSIEPQSVSDLSTILQIVGNETIRAPFAIKGGGHAFNNGFSSTLGVQVSMVNFKAVEYDSTEDTAKIGAGLTWDEVYRALEPFRVKVVGGRIPGVGVAGYTLGGGYSWFTDQFGLTIDTIVSYDLVLPNGTFAHVTNDGDPDLFFALKGGLNNYGVVTAFTLKTYPQTAVWGGAITYAGNVSDLVHDAASQFSLTKTDPKAGMIFTHYLIDNVLTITAYVFYDAPTQPGVFNAFLAIPSETQDLRTRTLVDFLISTFGNGTSTGETRELGAMVPIQHYTTPVFDAVVSQLYALAANAQATNHTSLSELLFSSEPFTSPFTHSTPSAYPHSPTRQITPADPNVVYTDAADDAYFTAALKALVHVVQAVAVAEGQSRWDDNLYSNYVLADTPVSKLFGGEAAVQKLAAIRERVDPNGVMALTGGFKL
ncbi:FAD-binding domain-containing protein [Artomyces pyxidatus]|uniref:FAD-binding domain-containing protein n=1 Tax=Artomyces pyxidatus TaxID=48021 RepID=A0ACB8TEX8_9AGAM|nr:FAD-binding domain-containing protein [Artomyces pyxidatus]